MTLHSLPLFVRMADRPVMLIGEGEAADAKRRLLERAGAVIVGEDAQATLAVVALEDEAQAQAAVARLRARGVLVNAVDRPALCDFTLPAIVDRDPVLVAIGTGGVSAGLAAALRQRLELLLPATLGRLAEALFASRSRLRDAYPDAGQRRRALAEAMAAGAPLDLLLPHDDTAVEALLAGTPAARDTCVTLHIRSDDPEELTLRDARLLASADRVVHAPGIARAILDRARADATRLPAPEATSADVAADGPGLTVRLERA